MNLTKRYFLSLFFFIMYFQILSATAFAQQSMATFNGYVVKKNGEKLHGSIKVLEHPTGYGAFILFNDSTKYSFWDIDSLVYNQQEFIFHKEGNFQKAGAKFKVHLKKKIVYGPFEIYTKIGKPSDISSKLSYNYFSLHNEQINHVSYSNLADELNKQPECATIMVNVNRNRYWSKISLMLGSATMLYGLVKTEYFKEKYYPTKGRLTIRRDSHSTVFVGLGLLLSSKIFHVISQRNLRKAIDRFNN